jgi:hypothetical protein
MTDPAIGARLAGFEIVEHVRGDLLRAQYRGRELATGRAVLITTGTEQRDLAAVAGALALDVPGIAPLRHVGPIAIAGTTFHAMVEDEPAGAPVTPADRATAVWIVLETARIVRAAHARGVAIGGLRPELIYGWGTLPQLAGVAPRCERFWITAKSPSPGVVSPFPCFYLAPELLRRPFDPPAPAADVFSLYAILAHWLAGEHPFEGEANQQILTIAAGRRRPWRGSEDDGDTIALGLADDPDDRQDLDTLIRWLEAE